VVLVAVMLLASGGCFATREDVRLLQTDVRTARAERAASDSAVRAQLAVVEASLTLANDSIRALGARVTRMQGDVRGDLYSLGQQLITIQELSGQSQRRLQELRASLEERNQQGVVGSTLEPGASGPAAAGGVRGPVAGVPAGPGGVSAGSPTALPSVSPAGSVSGPAPGVPGPNALFQLALDQLRRGSAGAARAGFTELLRQYPQADIADEVQFYLAEALAAEGNVAAADTAYAAVVTRYPGSPRAATAMYKRAMTLERGGNTAGARAVLQELVARYPRSDEAALARERLRTMK
jgi:tol-pal system protein YbgF